MDQELTKYVAPEDVPFLNFFTLSAQDYTHLQARCIDVRRNLKEVHGQTDAGNLYIFDHYPCQYAQVVGMVVEIKNDIEFTVDDGTEVLDCAFAPQRKQANPRVEGEPKLLRPRMPVLGDLLRVRGRIQPEHGDLAEGDTKTCVLLKCAVEWCEDINEEARYSVHCAMVRRTRYNRRIDVRQELQDLKKRKLLERKRLSDREEPSRADNAMASPPAVKEVKRLRISEVPKENLTFAFLKDYIGKAAFRWTEGGQKHYRSARGLGELCPAVRLRPDMLFKNDHLRALAKRVAKMQLHLQGVETKESGMSYVSGRSNGRIPFRSNKTGSGEVDKLLPRPSRRSFAEADVMKRATDLIRRALMDLISDGIITEMEDEVYVFADSETLATPLLNVLRRRNKASTEEALTQDLEWSVWREVIRQWPDRVTNALERLEELGMVQQARPSLWVLV